jgi:NagD protein
MFHCARKKLVEAARGVPESVVMIGDTMETDIRGAVESGLLSYLVLSGSTTMELVGDYVYQPTRILGSVADLVEEVRTGIPSDGRIPGSGERGGFTTGKAGSRHQTDVLALHKPRPRPAMTK